MAENTMTPERMKAGEDYLAALRKLGLEPEALLWAYHEGRKEFTLALITSLADRVGPKEIYETLFEAYDHAGTPASIDPWIVTVFSPRTVFDVDFNAMMGMEATVRPTPGVEIDGEMWFMAGDYMFRKSWVYVARRWNAQSKHQMKAWDNFRQNVSRLAA
jgi:hypothetical protein